MAGIKIAVLISGGGSNLQALINNINSGLIKGEILLVVSNKKDAYGLIRAKEHGIETLVLEKSLYKDRKKRDAILLEALKLKDIDLIVLAGYLEIVPKEIIEEYRNKIINIHPSLIPSFCGDGYYGQRVHKAVLERGVKVTGATVHFVNEITDGGPIILQETVPVDFYDDVKSLQQKVLKVEHRLLPLAVKLFAENKLQVIDNKVKILKDKVFI